MTLIAVPVVKAGGEGSFPSISGARLGFIFPVPWGFYWDLEKFVIMALMPL
jgi:hypothetical protein